MKAWKARQWSCDMDGLSLHNYTVVRWPPKYGSVRFGETEYGAILKATLDMENLVATHSAIMDKYDPEKTITLVVDEWGAWYAPLAGSKDGFLVQQNSLRDALLASLNLNIFARHANRVRMANIAQMINVLQAMIITDKGKMVLTPTYDVFRMYVAFQNSTFVPVTFSAGELHPRRRYAAARGCHRREGCCRHAVARRHQYRPHASRRDRGAAHRHEPQDGGGRNADGGCRGQREHRRDSRGCNTETRLGDSAGRPADRDPGAEVGDGPVSS